MPRITSIWLEDTRSLPAIESFVDGLPPAEQGRLDQICEFASQLHPLHERLRRSRSTLFHYPTMHPDRAAAGQEELKNALEEAAGLDGWLEGGPDDASFRAKFADEVALQFLTDDDESTLGTCVRVNEGRLV